MKWRSLVNEPPKKAGDYVIVDVNPDEFSAYYPHVIGWTDLGWNTVYGIDGEPMAKSRIFFEEKEEANTLYYCRLEDWNDSVKELVFGKEVK